MRFLIINGSYDEFLQWFYVQHPGLERQPYEEQMRMRVRGLHGLADFYPSNLRKLGHQAWNIYANDAIMQTTWAKEHGIRPGRSWELRFRLRRGVVPWINIVHTQAWLYDILAAQIEHYKPDVLLNMQTGLISTTFLQEMKGHLRLLIGWGNPGVLTYEYYRIPYKQGLPQDWSVYDLILAPQEGMVDYFRGLGIKGELLRHAFEPRLLPMINVGSEKPMPVSFVGLLRGGGYKERRKLLETLCARMDNDIFIWASSLNGIPPESSIRKRHQGHAWGQDLYRISANSKVALNCHSELEEQFAGNKRLFDVTGLGTLLITDRAKDLHKIFELDKEVVTYRNIEECVELMQYYLEHDNEREVIAHAGQQRTLREHTYCHRMQELVDITRKYL
jgi:hypothetical protein